MASVPEESKCQYTFLGKSGLRVSNICLGTSNFGETDDDGQQGRVDEVTCHALINRFVEWGGNFIDTANVYGRGASENVVGSWLSGQERDRLVIATKVRGQMDSNNPNGVGLGRKHIVRSVEQSLERLQTDYIDLLQIHRWDEGTPIEETLRTLNDLVKCGKVRYLGASNVIGWQLQKIVDFSERMGFNPFISLQQQYNLIARGSEVEAFQVCKLNGLGVLPYSPLKGGFLAGKVRRGADPEEGRLQRSKTSENNRLWASVNTDQGWDILETVEKVAKAKGKSPAQVSLRWLLQRSVVSSVIIGATKLHQLEDNMAAANGWELTSEEMKELNDVSQPDLPYPYQMIWNLNAARNSPWNPTGYV